jgi:Putative peptidoglycan binding domain
MKPDKFVFLALALVVGACAPKQVPVAVVAPAPVMVAPPAPLVMPTAAPAPDPALAAAAQRNLRTLGYNPGKSSDSDDPAFQKAILAFEKDHGLAEDAHLTPALVERMEAVHAALVKAAADSNRSALFVYSDGTVRRQALGLLIAPPDGLVSDAPANFLLPLRPNSQGIYHLNRRAPDGGISPVSTVTCRAGKPGAVTVALGAPDAIKVECHGDGSPALQWRATYSAKAGAVLRLEDSSGVHELVAIRPVTANWPSAARTGLDWAVTHALDTAVITPVPWSSTGVSPHFQISAMGATLSGHDAGLSGRYAALPCRRFDMLQSGTPVVHYPGIACQEAGQWSLPGSKVAFASPVNAIASRAPSR